MKRQKILTVLIVIVVLLILVIITFGQRPSPTINKAQQVEYLIGMSHPNLTDEWQIVVHEEMESKAKNYKNVKMIFTNAGGSSYKQINDIEKLLDYGIDLLIITVNDANVLGPIIDEVNQTIPVIVLDKDINYYNYTLFIGPDYYHVGEMAAKHMIDLSDDRYMNIITINGPIEEPSVAQMRKGFTDIINESNHIHIKENVYVNWLRTEAKTEMAKVIQQTTQFGAIFAQSNALALGAQNALKDAGINVPVITVSEFLSEKYLTYLELEELDAILYTPVGGKEAIDYAIKVLEDNSQIPKRIIMKSFPVTKENKSVFTEDKNYEKNVKIGYIQTDLWEENHLQYHFGLSDEEDIEWAFYEIDQEKTKDKKDTLQKMYFKSLVDQDVNMIFLQPESSQGWEKLIELAEEKEIYVICLGNMIDIESDRLIYIGPDYTDQGVRLASYLINNVYSVNYDIGILEITGDMETQKTMEKSSGFKQKISGYSRIRILDTIEGYSNNEILSYNIKQNLIKYANDINVIYTHEDYYIGAIKDALRETDLDDIVVISNNDTGEENNDQDIHYQVYPVLLYESQINTLIQNYNETRQIDIEKIYLPNKEY